MPMQNKEFNLTFSNLISGSGNGNVSSHSGEGGSDNGNGRLSRAFPIVTPTATTNYYFEIIFRDIGFSSAISSSTPTTAAATISTPFNFTTTSTLLSVVAANDTAESFERNNVTASTESSVFESKLIIPLYVIIFVLAVVGNTLVLVTLMRNKRMRTVTNVYLLNLAVSDLLLGVFCMPFTLVGQVLRNFIFGLTMCKLIPYFQAVSVSVGVWTLVAISLERYFAICRPLKSRRWQTQFHAYKMIAVVWLASLFWSGPVLVVSSLRAMKRGHKCREDWPSMESEQIFNLFLDVMLLLIPMIIMSLAYSLIMSKLWKGLQREIEHNTSCQKQVLQRSCSSPTIHEVFTKNNNSSSHSDSVTLPLRQHRLAPPPPPPCNARIMTMKKTKEKKKKKNADKTETVKLWLMKGFVQVRLPKTDNRKLHEYTKSTLVPSCKLTTPSTEHISSNGHYATTTTTTTTTTTATDDYDNEPRNDETTYTFSRHAIRSNYMDKSIEAKRKVIRMLFVIVAEFFICWAPLHILNTWYLFYPQDVYKYVGSTGIALVQLLAYFSSCCNPITYCFMNKKFRQAFLTVFNCYSCCICISEDKSGTSRCPHNGLLKVVQNHSDVSCNDSTVYVGRASTIGRSEVVVLEAEDRV